MTTTQHNLMNQLYGCDVWQDFQPRDAIEVHGWNGVHPSLTNLAESGGSVAIDVGVWKGQSTITLARAMKDLGIDGCVIAVDTFLGSPEHWNVGGELFNRKHGLPDLFQTFLSNVFHADVSDYIIPLPQTSVCAANILRSRDITASLVHIDAAHEYPEVLRDAEEYWPLISKGGFLIGDDYHPTWPGVIRAAGEFSAKNLLPLVIDPPKWIVRKPG